MARAKRRRLLSGWLSVLATLALALCAGAASAVDVVEYYHTDAIGNVRVVTDASGNAIERHDYLPFGEEWCGTAVCGSATPGQPLRFTGKERDAETGLDYFGARYYRASHGRFTTVDPVYTWKDNLVDPQRWNRYAHGRGNPLRYVDPNGENVRDVAMGAVNAFGSNIVLGLGRVSGGNRDFRFGQAVGDLGSVVAATYEFELGGGTAVLGGVVTFGSLGLASEVSVPAGAAGALVAAHAVVMGGSGLVHLAKALREGGGGERHPPKERTIQGTQDQLENIQEAQDAARRSGEGERIRSIKKSEQNLDNELKKVRNLDDAKRLEKE